MIFKDGWSASYVLFSDYKYTIKTNKTVIIPLISAICASNNDCTETEECLYTNANRYECLCKEGYVRDSQNLCVDGGNTCGGGTCVENAECLYDGTYETHYCSCKTGYVGDGITECKIKPIGCNILNNCGLHGICMFDEETELHICRCQEGFYGDGFVCHLGKLEF